MAHTTSMERVAVVGHAAHMEVPVGQQMLVADHCNRSYAACRAWEEEACRHGEVEVVLRVGVDDEAEVHDARRSSHWAAHVVHTVGKPVLEVVRDAARTTTLSR